VKKLGEAAVAVAASIETPLGVTTDTAGNVYFVSVDFNSVFKFSQDGTLTRIAGSFRGGYSGDGGPANSARLELAC
jgi:hypothetical protein